MEKIIQSRKNVSSVKNTRHLQVTNSIGEVTVYVKLAESYDTPRNVNQLRREPHFSQMECPASIAKNGGTK